MRWLWLSPKTSSGVPLMEDPFPSYPSHSVGSRDQGKQGEDWNEALDRELHPQCPDWGAHGPVSPRGGRRKPNIPTPSPQHCPRLFPTAPALPPATLAPCGPSAAPRARPARGVPGHTHTSLPVPPAPPGAKARSRDGFGVSRPSRGAGAPAGPPSGPGLARRALRRTGERGAASRPESPAGSAPHGPGPRGAAEGAGRRWS